MVTHVEASCLATEAVVMVVCELQDDVALNLVGDTTLQPEMIQKMSKYVSFYILFTGCEMWVCGTNSNFSSL